MAQMIEAIEIIHNLDYIHKDIKPDNFRVHDNKLLLIDFGLSMKLTRPDGTHLPRERYGFEGTLFFGSIRALQGYTLSRRDDIECIGYSILYLMNPDLHFIPWAT
jgi:serine/threonine protein kinase